MIVPSRGHFHEEESLFSLGALVRQVEKLNHRGVLVVDAQLLEHPAVSDALAERGDDLGARNVRDLVAHLAEPLDVLAERLILLLHYGVQIVVGEGALVRPDRKSVV